MALYLGKKVKTIEKSHSQKESGLIALATPELQIGEIPKIYPFQEKLLGKYSKTEDFPMLLIRREWENSAHQGSERVLSGGHRAGNAPGTSI